MSLSNLPEEIILHCLSFLDKASNIIHFSITNKRNKDIVERNKDYIKIVTIISDKSNYDRIIGKISTKTDRYDSVEYFLPKIYGLDLSFCKLIKNVSMLKNVKKLNLAFCNGITDVSMLKSVKILNLMCCYNITDVSTLKRNVKNIIL